MRSGRIALVLTGLLLASTSAVGIVLWNSYQADGGAGSLAVADPVIDTNADIITGSNATVAAIFNPSAMGLQYDEDLLNAVLPFEQAQDVLGLPDSDSITPELDPLSIDMALAHVQRRDEIGTSGALLASATVPAASALASSRAMRWRDTMGGGGGGGGGGTGKGSNPQNPAPGNVGNTGPAGEQEQPGGRDHSPDDSNHQGGGSNGGQGSESPTAPTGPTEPTDHLPPEPVNPVVNPPVSVPEPGTLGLVLMGAAGMLFGRRKRQATNAQ